MWQVADTSSMAISIRQDTSSTSLNQDAVL
jgi:hypothetical protein